MVIRRAGLSLRTYADGVLICSYGLVIEVVESTETLQSDGLVAMRETREDPLQYTSG